ncbi:MAG: hypothetical protein PVJ25_00070 [Desulfuromonadales bacterium]
MKKASLKKFTLGASFFIAMAAASAMAAANTTAAESGEYLAGDFHQHTYYTDGSHVFAEHMAENNMRLDWWANSEHGGERNRDGEGHYWSDTTYYPENPILGDFETSGTSLDCDTADNRCQEMWRWQSLRDYVYPDILEARALYQDKTIINGLEWYPPGHEHCSTAIHQFDGTATAMSQFAFQFDGSLDDNSRVGEPSAFGPFDTLQKINGKIYPNGDNTGEYSKDPEDQKLDSIEAVKYMQSLVGSKIAEAWVIPAHVERAHRFFIEDFRNWQDAGPDVAYGAEFAPGHQTSSDRGFGRGSLGGGTYGGTGFYASQIGGLWDGMLAEGRKYFFFASSDDHRNWRQGGSDFWPGEYQKQYTYVDTSADDQIAAVFEGNRSGNTWNVQGDLIDELEFTAQNKSNKATMGETLVVKKGDQVKIKIKVHDPNTPNQCPLDMDNPSLAQIGIYQPLNMPVLDHIDLIGATITGKVPMTDFSDVDNQSYVNTDYGTDAKVIATFKRHGGIDKDGYLTYVTQLKVDKPMYVRLRGTNLPANVPFETDAEGNPLADSLANDNLYDAVMDDNREALEAKLFSWVEYDTNDKLPEVAEAFADLWFYSNPIFIDVVKGKK